MPPEKPLRHRPPEPQVPRSSSPCCDDRDLFCEVAWARIARQLELSPRQAQIARCLLADLSDEEIARSLGLAWNTIRCHVQRLHEKLGAHSRLQLATRIFAVYRDRRAESYPPVDCQQTTDLNGSCEMVD